MQEKRITVLAVDDDARLLRMLRLVLRESFEVCTADHGAAALDQLDRCHPDVIVLDLEMPVMDGATFLNTIRSSGCETPVLILSSGDAARLRLVQAEGYLPKPFAPDELASKIKKLAAA